MKKMFLLSMLLAVANIAILAQDTKGQDKSHHYFFGIPLYDESFNLPSKVDYAIGRLMDIHGNVDEASIEKFASPESGKLISLNITIPFKGEINNQGGNQDEIEKLIREVKIAFAEEQDKAYNSGHYQPAKGNSEYATTTGPYMNSIKKIIPTDDYEFVVMEIKGRTDPTMREFYCVCWKKSGNVFNGYVYLIYSKRPDLIADEEEREEQGKAQSMADVMPEYGTVAQKMAVLERLSKQYQDEIYRLSKEITNPLYNQSKGTIGVRSELLYQIRDYRSKLQEVLAEMQVIVEEM